MRSPRETTQFDIVRHERYDYSDRYKSSRRLVNGFRFKSIGEALHSRIPENWDEYILDKIDEEERLTATAQYLAGKKKRHALKVMAKEKREAELFIAAEKTRQKLFRREKRKALSAKIKEAEKRTVTVVKKVIPADNHAWVWDIPPQHWEIIPSKPTRLYAPEPPPPKPDAAVMLKDYRERIKMRWSTREAPHTRAAIRRLLSAAQFLVGKRSAENLQSSFS